MSELDPLERIPDPFEDGHMVWSLKSWAHTSMERFERLIGTGIDLHGMWWHEDFWEWDDEYTRFIPRSKDAESYITLG